MKSGRVIFGTFLILMGTSFFLEQLGVEGLWGMIWPWTISILGLYLMFRRRRSIAVFFLVIAGTILLGKVVGISAWSLFWPVIIIYIGLNMFLGRPSIFTDKKNESKSKEIDETAILSGLEKKITSKNFKGGEVLGIFGGVKLDLTEAKIQKDGAELSVSAVFGGVEIIVPEDMSLKTDGMGILGGWEDKSSNKDKNQKTLSVLGEAVFGGVTIRN